MIFMEIHYILKIKMFIVLEGEIKQCLLKNLDKNIIFKQINGNKLHS